MVSLRGRWHTRLRRRGGATLCGPSCSARGGRHVRLWTGRAAGGTGDGEAAPLGPPPVWEGASLPAPSVWEGRLKIVRRVQPPSQPPPAGGRRRLPAPSGGGSGRRPAPCPRRRNAGGTPALPGHVHWEGYALPGTLYGHPVGVRRSRMGGYVRLYQIGRTSATRGAQAMTLRSTPRAVASSSTTSSRSSQGP